MRRTVLCTAALLVVAQPTPGRRAAINALIKQLGDVDGTVREDASRRLPTMGGLLLDSLKEAMIDRTRAPWHWMRAASST